MACGGGDGSRYSPGTGPLAVTEALGAIAEENVLSDGVHAITAPGIWKEGRKRSRLKSHCHANPPGVLGSFSSAGGADYFSTPAVPPVNGNPPSSTPGYSRGRGVPEGPGRGHRTAKRGSHHLRQPLGLVEEQLYRRFSAVGARSPSRQHRRSRNGRSRTWNRFSRRRETD